MSLLSVSDLHVNIGHKPLLSGLDLQIEAGKVTALLGPNGAGKSTLLKAISADVACSAGHISMHGKPMQQWPRIELARELGVLPQHNSLSFPFTVQEVVEMGLFPLQASQAQSAKYVADAIEQVDVGHLLTRRYPTLSGGEKQRVQLARVLTQLAQAKQPLLLLDEPTSALDLAQQHRVLALAQQLAHQRHYTVIAVLHDLNQAARYADKLVVLSQGQIVAQGSASSVLTEHTIEQVWHYQPTLVTDPNHGTPVVL
ncbi:heme ABC transporter ATP-binding protein [uncultured Ferrimonas sp.]|uniref:heme ABC transporter ATP-binding protein n=1 Tax=uncultured Ferrimonas sp. TaxID=432640 RepID=UPI0026388093|nr:heme ABC transporter ATP-binding protein [uncultured Ferrimonas sp.]